MSARGGVPPEIREELRLLLLCARTHVDADEVREIRHLLSGTIDWASSVQAAIHHGVTPLLRQSLARGCPEAVPPTILEAFAVHCHRIQDHNRYLADELLAILAALEARGVPAIPFKGPVLAMQAYGDLSLRTFRDLDFLIHEEDIAATLAVLEARGYAVASPLTPAQASAVWRCLGQDSFVRKDGRVVVEPHWALTPDKMAVAIDYAGLWRRARPSGLDGAVVLGLPPEDVLIILAVHGAKEQWWRLNWVCDVAELVRAYPTLDWDVTLERARLQRCGRMLLLALALASRLLRAPLPPRVLSAVDSDRAVRGLAGEAVARLLSGTIRAGPGFNSVSRFRLRSHDSPWDRAAYLLRTLVKPSAKHYEMLALPERFFFGYYVLKPVHDYLLLPLWRLSKGSRRTPTS